MVSLEFPVLPGRQRLRGPKLTAWDHAYQVDAVWFNTHLEDLASKLTGSPGDAQIHIGQARPHSTVQWTEQLVPAS